MFTLPAALELLSQHLDLPEEGCNLSAQDVVQQLASTSRQTSRQPPCLISKYASYHLYQVLRQASLQQSVANARSIEDERLATAVCAAVRWLCQTVSTQIASPITMQQTPAGARTVGTSWLLKAALLCHGVQQVARQLLSCNPAASTAISGSTHRKSNCTTPSNQSGTLCLVLMQAIKLIQQLHQSLVLDGAALLQGALQGVTCANSLATLDQLLFQSCLAVTQAVLGNAIALKVSAVAGLWSCWLQPGITGTADHCRAVHSATAWRQLLALSSAPATKQDLLIAMLAQLVLRSAAAHGVQFAAALLVNATALDMGTGTRQTQSQQQQPRPDGKSAARQNDDAAGGSTKRKRDGAPQQRHGAAQQHHETLPLGVKLRLVQSLLEVVLDLYAKGQLDGLVVESQHAPRTADQGVLKRASDDAADRCGANNSALPVGRQGQPWEAAGANRSKLLLEGGRHGQQLLKQASRPPIAITVLALRSLVALGLLVVKRLLAGRILPALEMKQLLDILEVLPRLQLQHLVPRNTTVVMALWLRAGLEHLDAAVRCRALGLCSILFPHLLTAAAQDSSGTCLADDKTLLFHTLLHRLCDKAVSVRKKALSACQQLLEHLSAVDAAELAATMLPYAHALLQQQVQAAECQRPDHHQVLLSIVQAAVLRLSEQQQLELAVEAAHNANQQMLQLLLRTLLDCPAARDAAGASTIARHRNPHMPGQLHQESSGGLAQLAKLRAFAEQLHSEQAFAVSGAAVSAVVDPADVQALMQAGCQEMRRCLDPVWHDGTLLQVLNVLLVLQHAQQSTEQRSYEEPIAVMEPGLDAMLLLLLEDMLHQAASSRWARPEHDLPGPQSPHSSSTQPRCSSLCQPDPISTARHAPHSTTPYTQANQGTAYGPTEVSSEEALYMGSSFALVAGHLLLLLRLRMQSNVMAVEWQQYCAAITFGAVSSHLDHTAAVVDDQWLAACSATVKATRTVPQATAGTKDDLYAAETLVVNIQALGKALPKMQQEQQLGHCLLLHSELFHQLLLLLLRSQEAAEVLAALLREAAPMLALVNPTASLPLCRVFITLIVALAAAVEQKVQQFQGQLLQMPWHSAVALQSSQVLAAQAADQGVADYMADEDLMLMRQTLTDDYRQQLMKQLGLQRFAENLMHPDAEDQGADRSMDKWNLLQGLICAATCAVSLQQGRQGSHVPFGAAECYTLMQQSRRHAKASEASSALLFGCMAVCSLITCPSAVPQCLETAQNLLREGAEGSVLALLLGYQLAQHCLAEPAAAQQMLTLAPRTAIGAPEDILSKLYDSVQYHHKRKSAKGLSTA